MNCVFKFYIYFCIVEINKDRKEISRKKTDTTWQKFNMKLTKFLKTHSVLNLDLRGCCIGERVFS